MKKALRKHHHHHLNSLLIQYAHLNAEQRALAMEADILAIASTLDAAIAAKILKKIIDKFKVHR